MIQQARRITSSSRALLLALLLGLAVYSPVHGTNQGPALSRHTHAILTQIRDLMDAGKSREAIKRLQALKKRLRGKTYALALVDQHLGYAWLDLDDPEAARRAFEASLLHEDLPQKVKRANHYLLAQLYLQADKPQRAVTHLEQVLTMDDAPQARVHGLAAHVYYRLNRYDQAIRHARLAMDKAEAPEESWYRILLTIYLKQKRYKEAEPLLHRVIERFPERGIYWLQLASLSLERGRDRSALATLMLAYRQGRLQEPDLTRIAHLHAQTGIAEKAARLLRQWLDEGAIDASRKNLELEGHFWLLAKERHKAIETLQRIAPHAKDGKAELLLGKLYFQREQWPQAIKALQAGLEKGGIKNTAQAQLLLGIAAYHADRAELCSHALKQARTSKRFALQAEYWLDLLARNEAHPAR